MDVTIKATDMSDDLKDQILSIVKELMVPLTDSKSLERDVAREIKVRLDKECEPTWHVVIGKNFGSFITHEQGHFLYCYLGPWAILLFKTS